MKNIKIVQLVFLLHILLVHTTVNVCAVNVVKSISNIDGLSNNSVNCIFEDSENILWVGTWDGLNAYNGRDIKTFRYSRSSNKTISNNIIRQILEQDNKYIWISTDYGVNKWDRTNLTFERFYLGTENKVPKQENSYIIDIAPDGTVYCFVRNEGLFYFDNKQNKFVSISLSFSDYIKTFKIDGEGYIFFLFQDGDLLYKDIKLLAKVKTVNDLEPIHHTGSIANIFLLDKEIAITSQNKIAVLDKSKKVSKSIALNIDKNISGIAKNKNLIYISFLEGGCVSYSLDSDQYSFISEISDNTSLFTVYKGSQDILWFGSDGQGIIQFYDYNFPFQTVFVDHPVRSFIETNKDEILVGTKGGGIKLFNYKEKTLKNYFNTNNKLISNSIYAFYKNKDQDIFIGTEGEGINTLNKDSKELNKILFSANSPNFKAVYSICTSHNDSLLWVGTSGYGLLKFELKKRDGIYSAIHIEQYTSTKYLKSLKNDIVYSISYDKTNDNIWFGTRGGGLYRLNVKSNSLDHLDKVDSNMQLTNNDILSIAKASTPKQLWVGTSYGLNLLDFDKQNITYYTEEEGLNNNTIHGIISDTDGKVWVSTNQGISVIDNQGKVDNFTMNIGLQNDEFSDGAYFKASDDIIYFGGVRGFNYFNPQKIKRRDFVASLSLNSLKIYNTSENIFERIKNNTLNLSYNERYVAFDWVAKEFINNENCEYAYRLYPETTEWTPMGTNSSIIFSKLGWGKYILEVKNTNGDKVWNEDIYKLNIIVGAPWWLSIPAIFGYTLIILLALFITRYLVKQRIRMNRRLLIQEVEKQHQQKAYDEKLNFFTNVAHEFFTPLTLIYGPAQHLLENSKLDEYSSKYLHTIKNNAERMQRLISELMEFRQAKTGFTSLQTEKVEIQLLIDYVSDNYEDIMYENKINYKIENKNLSTLYTDRNSLEKIFMNLISNAFKYTPSSGYIWVDIFQDDNTTLYLTITNSGKGLTDIQMKEIFDKHKIFDSPRVKGAVSTGIGLNLTKSLVELLGGTIKVSSTLGENVKFEIMIPPLANENIEETINISNNGDEGHILTTQHTLINKHTKEISILIVEDEKDIRHLLKDILSPFYNVVEAIDGKQAMEIIMENHPDIIISDIMMPNIDGIEMIKKLKNNEKLKHIPIISISAKTSTEDKLEAYEYGADLYITKPFHPKYILVAVRNLIKKQELLKDYYRSSASAITVMDGLEIHKDDEKTINEIIKFVHDNMEDEALSPADIADFMHISKATLYRYIREMINSTPSEFIRKIRLEHAAKLLLTTKLTASEVMYKCGFSNKSYFYREFKKIYNSTPVGYRENNMN